VARLTDAPCQIAGSTKIAGLVNGGCWIAQFIGHGAFEGRAPALFDNLFQCRSDPSPTMKLTLCSAVVLAVFFVWMELLFSLGYKPELHRRLQDVRSLHRTDRS
jgi:uncharacterized membrane protein YGL010W